MNSTTQLMLIEKIERYYDCDEQVTYLDDAQVQSILRNKLPSVKRIGYTTCLVRQDSRVLNHFYAEEDYLTGDALSVLAKAIIDIFKLDDEHSVLMRVYKSNTKEPVFHVFSFDWLDDEVHEVITEHNYSDSVELIQDAIGCYIAIRGEPVWTDSKECPGYTPETRLYFEKHMLSSK